MFHFGTIMLLGFFAYMSTDNNKKVFIERKAILKQYYVTRKYYMLCKTVWEKMNEKLVKILFWQKLKCENKYSSFVPFYLHGCLKYIQNSSALFPSKFVWNGMQLLGITNLLASFHIKFHKQFFRRLLEKLFIVTNIFSMKHDMQSCKNFLK